MTEELEKSVKSLTREVKLLNKKLARSETNRAQAERMKDETDVLYETVLRQVEAQKEEIEEGQAKLNDAFEVITGSITYASRIQRSVLPDTTILDATLADHFIYWEPRDVVGGDIYWVDAWGEGILIILGDCTGHGVPGAFMTLIASGALDRAKTEVVEGDVENLIRRMHQLIQLTLGQHKETGESDDGMELGACFINGDLESLVFTGAGFRLISLEDGEIEEYRGSKKGLGYCGIPFAQEYGSEVIEMRKGQRFYMTSDGLIDQVGGLKHRTFGRKRFKEILLSLLDVPMIDHAGHLHKALLDHQGTEIRRDDVSVIGFEV